MFLSNSTGVLFKTNSTSLQSSEETGYSSEGNNNTDSDGSNDTSVEIVMYSKFSKLSFLNEWYLLSNVNFCLNTLSLDAFWTNMNGVPL